MGANQVDAIYQGLIKLLKNANPTITTTKPIVHRWKHCQLRKCQRLLEITWNDDGEEDYFGNPEPKTDWRNNNYSWLWYKLTQSF